MKTLEQLKQQLKEIEDRCDHWKSCTDGSHGMALDNAGYYEVLEQIKQLQNE